MKYIYICGSDGAGKSTQIAMLENHIKNKEGKSVKYFYFRYPRFFSRLCLLYGKLRGFTKYEKFSDHNHWYHEFYRSNFLKRVYPILMLFDMKLKWYFESKNINPNSVMLTDRFVYDTLVDVMVETNRLDLYKNRLGKKYVKILPDDMSIVLLLSKYSEIKTRRPDLVTDKWLSTRIELYGKLAQYYHLKVIDANQDKNIIFTEIVKEYLKS